MTTTRTITLRIQTRDGNKRIEIDNSSTVSQLKSSIEKELGIPAAKQALSTDKNILLAKTEEDLHRFSNMSDPNTTLCNLELSQTSFVYMLKVGSLNKKAVDNDNQKEQCSGTKGSFTCQGQQNIKDSTLNTGANAGNSGGSCPAWESRQQHGVSGTQGSFTSMNGSQNIEGSTINSGENTGNCYK